MFQYEPKRTQEVEKEGGKMKMNHRSLRRNDDIKDESSNNYSYISGYLKGGSPLHDFINNPNQAYYKSATGKIVSGILKLLEQLDQSLLTYSSVGHQIFLNSSIVEQQRRIYNHRRTKSDSWPNDSSSDNCESSITSSESDDNGDDDDDDDSISSSISTCSHETRDNSGIAHESRTVPSKSCSSAVTSPCSRTLNSNNDEFHTTCFNLEASRLSVLSTQAEAYYAQTSVASQLLESSLMSERCGLNNPDSSNDRLFAETASCRLSVPSTEQLGNNYNNTAATARIDDYDTLSQIDILRMTRLASRHLDVASIFQLPTVTYRSNLKRQNKQPNDQGHQKVNQPSSTSSFPNKDRPEFSWMMVHKEEADESSSCHDDSSSFASQGYSSLIGHKITPTRAGGITDSYDTDDQRQNVTECDDQDVCVICLEHFVDGDRIRLLPCSHSFHVGCIDCWLLGVHSFDRCFTAGCPTCRKHPCASTSLAHSSKQKVKAAKHWTASQMSECSSRDSTNDCTEQDDDSHFISLEESTDGSVPSWAFVLVGVSLERES